VAEVLTQYLRRYGIIDQIMASHKPGADSVAAE